MALPDVSLRRPVATAMLYVGIAVLGVVSFLRLPIDLLPDVAFPTLSVWTTYSDAGPAEVERFITEPIEQQLYSIPGARRISSRSREGQSLVQLQFAWGTDMEFATLHTREKLDNLTERLPEGSERPTILRSDPTSDPIMTLAVSGTDLRSLRDLSEVVFKRRLEQLDGVSLAGLTGGPERELRVIVDPEYLDVHEVSLSEISNALDQANYNAPGGTIQRGRFEYSLRTLGQFREVEELLDVVIARPRGVGARPVVLADVATVVDTIADLETIARFNGEPAIGLQVFKEAGTNTVRVADGVRETLDQLREEFQGISIEIASSQAAFIRDAISNVVSALLLGGALAFLVLFLFLRDPRYPLAIGLAIPISVMAAFALCYAFDVSLNIMSLGGLALGVGLLVDNSIVVLENIFRHREESGGSARASAGRGAREVAAAITASTLTTIAVFGPVLYVEGVAGALFGDLSLAVTFSLLASLLVALTLLPVLAAQVARGKRGAEAAGFDGEMSPSEQPEAAEAERPGRVRRFGRAVRAGAVAGVRGVGGGVAYVGRSVKLTGVDVATGGGRVLGLLFGPFLRAFERAFLRFADRYERTLEWALAHRLEVLSIAVVALAGAVMLAGSLPRGLMPRVDEQQFWVELNLPQGTPIRTTDEAAGEVERLLLDMADVSGIFTRVGRSRGSELAARDLTGLNNAALDVQLAGSSRPTSEAIAELRARLPGSGVDPAFVTIETGRATSLGRALAIGEADLAVKVQSGELEELVPVAEAIETRLEGVPALADVRLDFLRTQPELVIEVNREVAARHQITVTSVATAIEDYLRGSETRNAYSVFADKVDIRVTIPETARRELDRVLGLRLQGVPIGELVTVRQGFGPVEIRREDQNRTIQVLADVAEGGLRTAVREVEAAIADIPRPALTTVRVGGENEEMQDSFRSLTFAFGLALALVFLIMAAQFESLVQPLVVLTAVPLAAIGAVTALWIAGGGLNAMSGIGFVILIGIVVNDAIVKVDFINQRRRAGLAKRAAILEAGRLRLRPIVMTTITTVVGLLPLAAGLGAGADLRAPLAVVVIGGLISATFLTLIVVPVVYSVLVEPSVSVGPDPGPRPERRDPSAVRPTPGYGLGGRSGPAAPGMARGSVEP
ncbi:MAG: efflux RND transporter permease subunit [Gemmatimonadota bacterium]|uniref:efflux RND transporter permease subunit n=2 Tax=Candidatus Palauibacter TaxID=3056650 RepID=UPI0023891190|nr:efflux RND transporter permease subunit [Candidatus Palauibacter scopulicola]MDE2662075.1 efflux RND transporter permease subunit [Candidatus Palauibacter scopulicola]